MRRIGVGQRLILVFIALVTAGAVVFYLRPVECARQMLYLRLALSGVKSGSVLVGGHRMHYDAVGPEGGAPVVLVHGLGGHAEDWINLAPFLTRAGYRVYLPDLPGFGRSEQPKDFSYSIPDQAEAVCGFMDAMGVKQVDLGGWSMGGWIVQQIAAKHPQRVKRLLLFDSAGLSVRPDWDTALFTPKNAGELEQLEKLLMPVPPKAPGFIATDMLRASDENAWVVRRALDSMLTGKDVTDTMLPELKMAVLLVWGELDRVTPVSLGEKMHGLIPQSQLEVFPGCGHLAPAQCADKLGPKVAEFLHE